MDFFQSTDRSECSSTVVTGTHSHPYTGGRYEGPPCSPGAIWGSASRILWLAAEGFQGIKPAIFRLLDDSPPDPGSTDIEKSNTRYEMLEPVHILTFVLENRLEWTIAYQNGCRTFFLCFGLKTNDFGCEQNQKSVIKRLHFFAPSPSNTLWRVQIFKYRWDKSTPVLSTRSVAFPGAEKTHCGCLCEHIYDATTQRWCCYMAFQWAFITPARSTETLSTMDRGCEAFERLIGVTLQPVQKLVSCSLMFWCAPRKYNLLLRVVLFHHWSVFVSEWLRNAASRSFYVKKMVEVC